MTVETATFGAGCFWGVEWVFRQVPGVLDAVSGFSGGSVPDADVPGGLSVAPATPRWCR